MCEPKRFQETKRVRAAGPCALGLKIMCLKILLVMHEIHVCDRQMWYDIIIVYGGCNKVMYYLIVNTHGVNYIS